MGAHEIRDFVDAVVKNCERIEGWLRKQGADALTAGNYEKADVASKHAQWLLAIRRDVEGLYDEWNEKFEGKTDRRRPRPRVGTESKRPKKTSTTSRLVPGLRTPERSFRRPILEALVELGGRARVRDVLDRVHEKMKNKLNEYDYQPLSDGKSERWSNNARWCRNTLVNEGLLRSDSPRGVWEITDRGRERLAKSGEV